MLQYSTVEPRTLELLKQLIALPELEQFYLAGGTALALYRGHRLSIDLFSTGNFSADDILPVLEVHFPGFTYSDPYNPVGIFSFIDNIKVDFVRHHNFPLIDQPVIENNIRLIGIRDIMAMKIAAIMKRGVKKDFWDIAELLQTYQVQDFINAYNEKYPNQQLLISIPKVMTYFEDAEESEEPISLKSQTWASVKSIIQVRVNEYLKS